MAADTTPVKAVEAPPLQPLALTSKLAGTPTRAPKYSVTVKNAAGQPVVLGDPRAARELRFRWHDLRRPERLSRDQKQADRPRRIALEPARRVAQQRPARLGPAPGPRHGSGGPRGAARPRHYRDGLRRRVHGRRGQ